MQQEVQRKQVENEAGSEGTQGLRTVDVDPAHLRSCLRRAKISSPRRADPSSAVSTLRCSLAFSPASLRLLSSRSSRLLNKSAVPSLGAERARVTTHSPSLLSRVTVGGEGGGEIRLLWRKRNRRETAPLSLSC